MVEPLFRESAKGSPAPRAGNRDTFTEADRPPPRRVPGELPRLLGSRGRLMVARSASPGRCGSNQARRRHEGQNQAHVVPRGPGLGVGRRSSHGSCRKRPPRARHRQARDLRSATAQAIYALASSSCQVRRSRPRNTCSPHHHLLHIDLATGPDELDGPDARYMTAPPPSTVAGDGRPSSSTGSDSARSHHAMGSRQSSLRPCPNG